MTTEITKVKEFIKANYLYWIKTSVFTFLAVALPMFAADVALLDYGTLETAGLGGAFVVVLRLAMKAGWFGLVSLVQYLALKSAPRE